MKKEKSFIKAGAVLVVSGFIVKVLGAVYRIPLTRMLGAAQMGRYSAVFSLFMPFFSIATAGIVPCVSHYTSKTDKEYFGAVKGAAYRLYIFQAAVMALCFVLFGKVYSQIQGDSMFFCGSVILAPAIIFAAAENICKGVTQGRMNMLPTASANVVESVLKTVLGLAGVYFAGKTAADSDTPVMAGLMAVTAAGFICCIYLLKITGQKGNKTKKFSQKKAEYVKVRQSSISAATFFRMSFPIAISALVISLSAFFDTAVCIPRISRIPYADIVKSYSGASFKNAGDMPMYLLGIYQGMVLSVFNLLPAVLSYMGAASLPVISRGISAGNSGYVSLQTQRLFTVTAGLSIPATVYIHMFRYDILQFLFGTNGAQTQVSAQLLDILLLGSVFCCFTAVLNSVLYACGRSVTVFRILLTASAVKCILSYILCGIPQINIKAFAVSAVVFHTIIFILSVHSVNKLGINCSPLKVFFMPCAATAVSVAGVKLMDNMALCWLPLLLRIGFSGLIYSLIYMLIAIITGFLLISTPENSNI